MSFWEAVNDPSGILGWAVICSVIGFFAMCYWIIDCIADVKMAKWESIAARHEFETTKILNEFANPSDCGIRGDSLGDNGIRE